MGGHAELALANEVSGVRIVILGEDWIQREKTGTFRMGRGGNGTEKRL